MPRHACAIALASILVVVLITEPAFGQNIAVGNNTASGHTLNEILDWIQSKMNSNWTTFQPESDQSHGRNVVTYTGASDHYEGCMIRLHASLKLTYHEGEWEYTYDAALNLSHLDPNSIHVTKNTMDSGSRLYLRSKLPEITFTGNSGVTSAKDFEINLSTQDQAERVAKAFKDAALLCGATGPAKDIY